MAKFIVTYDVCVGDIVTIHTNDGSYQNGVVQDISQLPDVFVEGFADGKYTRWRVGVESLEFNHSREESGVTTKIKFGEDESVEFVHGGNLGTKDFEKLEYRKLGKDFNLKRK